MPRVPTLQPQVQTAALNAPKMNIDTPLEAFGGGRVAESMGKAINNVAQLGQDLYKKERDRADKTAVANVERTLIENKIKILGQTTNEYKEGNAAGALSFADSNWSKVKDDSLKGLNERQKRLIQERIADMDSDLKINIYKHMDVEAQKADSNTFNSLIKVNQMDAVSRYTDPTVVAKSIGSQLSAVDEMASRQGWDSDTIKLKKLDVTSTTHKSIIEQQIANGQDELAYAYYKQNKEQIDPNEYAGMEKILDVSNTAGKAQRMADSILEKAGSRAEALEELKNIKDEKLRSETRKRLNEGYADINAAKEQDSNDAFEKLMTMADQYNEDGKAFDPELIAASDLGRMRSGDKTKLMKYIKELKGGGKIVDDPEVMEEWTIGLASPETRSLYMTKPISELRAVATPTFVKKVIDLRAKYAAAEPKTMAKAKGLLTAKEYVNLQISELKLNKEKAKAFTRKVDDQVDMWEEQNGKVATEKDIKSILNETTRRWVETGFFGGKSLRETPLDEELKTNGTTSAAPDSGEQDRVLRSIKERFKKKEGRDPTPQEQLNIYRVYMNSKKSGSRS
jgi:hypothetical protein